MAVVNINGYTSGRLKLEKAVRQGDPSAPYLFELYIDPLFKYVERRIQGIAITTIIFLKSLAFVDDGAFLPGSMADLMEVVRGLMWYEEHFLVKIHRKKSQLLNIGECARLDDSVWVEEAQSVKVLGALFERTAM